jgi:large subunit ribosomal protein L4
MATVKKTTKKVAPSEKKEDKPKAVKAAPLEVSIFSMSGEKVGSIALPQALFGAPWKSDLVHQVTTAMQANARQSRAHTKDRSEVSGGGKKPWAQKGTGQARHASTRSPIWRHGGITFGPRSERNWSEKINKKMRNGALVSALSKKAKDGEIILVDKFTFAEPKAAAAKVMLAKISSGASAAMLASKKKNAALLSLAAYDVNAIKSFSNFGNVMTEEARNLNPLSILTHKYLIIEKPEETFAALAKRVAN